jgi:hypothetical protein
VANWVGSRLQLRGGGDAEGGMGEAERDRRVEQAAAELLESSEEGGTRARPAGKPPPPPPSEGEDDSAPPTQVEPPSHRREPFRVVRGVVMLCTSGARLLLRALGFGIEG